MVPSGARSPDVRRNTLISQQHNRGDIPMKNLNRYFATSLIVFLTIGIFALAGYSRAAETDQGIQQGKMAIMEGAKKMMDGNKMIMDIMTKKGKMDADLTAADKMMTEGYNMVTKGEGMMTGATMGEGQAMVKHGSKMMLEAQKKTADIVEHKGMTYECTSALDTCKWAEQKIKEGALMWYFGGGI
jgi:hypothetical protein